MGGRTLPAWRNSRLWLVLTSAAAVLAGAVAFNPPLKPDAPPSFHMLPKGWFVRPGRASDWTPPNLVDAPTLTLRGQGFRVAVRPSAGGSLSIEPPSGAASAAISRDGRNLTIAYGEVEKRGKKPCEGSSAEPLFIVRAPQDFIVRIEGAVSGAVGRARNLTLANQGCGYWTVAQTDEDLRLVQLGPGRIQAVAALRGQARVEGRGEVSIDRAAEGLDAYVEGRGRVVAGTVDGAFDAEVWGPGVVAVERGVATRAVAFIKGRGQVRHGGAVGTFYAETRGGLVEIAEVRGSVSGSIVAGDIRYARPPGRRYCVGAACG